MAGNGAWKLFLVLLAPFACAPAPSTDAAAGDSLGGAAGKKAGSGGRDDGDGGGSQDRGGAAGTSGGAGGTSMPGSGGSSGAAPNATAVPCDVAAMLASKCGACHGDPPAMLAQESLVTYADLSAPSTEIPGKTMAQASLVLMKAMTMPPDPFPPATGADVATLQAWLDAGMPKMDCGGTGGAGGAPSTDCDPLADCCNSLPIDKHDACVAEEMAEATAPDAKLQCAATLAEIRSLGFCSGSGGVAGAGGSSALECGLTTSSADCNTCFSAFCCVAGRTCEAEAECGVALDCLAACTPGDGGCASTCVLEFADGDQKFLDALHCYQNVCADHCKGASGSGGSGGTGGAGGSPTCIADGTPCNPGDSCCSGACDPNVLVCPSCVPDGQFCLGTGATCCGGETCDPNSGVCVMKTAGMGGSGGASGSGGAGGSACLAQGASCSPSGIPCCTGSCNGVCGGASGGSGGVGGGATCLAKGADCSMNKTGCCSGVCNGFLVCN